MGGWRTDRPPTLRRAGGGPLDATARAAQAFELALAPYAAPAELSSAVGELLRAASIDRFAPPPPSCAAAAAARGRQWRLLHRDGRAAEPQEPRRGGDGVARGGGGSNATVGSATVSAHLDPSPSSVYGEWDG